ncbi:MAG: HAMP domain-containing histidine kinase [Planctomycetes bacterium]|nr:HAMP domain-containing histidine kinase [Planctomycetota bacterium]
MRGQSIVRIFAAVLLIMTVPGLTFLIFGIFAVGREKEAIDAKLLSNYDRRVKDLVHEINRRFVQEMTMVESFVRVAADEAIEAAEKHVDDAGAEEAAMRIFIGTLKRLAESPSVNRIIGQALVFDKTHGLVYPENGNHIETVAAITEYLKQASRGETFAQYPFDRKGWVGGTGIYYVQRYVFLSARRHVASCFVPISMEYFKVELTNMISDMSVPSAIHFDLLVGDTRIVSSPDRETLGWNLRPALVFREQTQSIGPDHPLADWRLQVAYKEEAQPLASTSRVMTGFVGAFAIILVVMGASVLTISVAREIRVAKLKSDFVSDVSHELKTPLTSIRMFIETLQMRRVKPEDDQYQEVLNIILEESERLSALIDRLLDFSRMERGTKIVSRKEDDFEKVLRDTIDLYKNQIRKGGGVLHLKFEKNLPKVWIDAGAIREIVINLLSNALKYSPSDKNVSFRAFRQGDTVRIEVTDKGIGIDPKFHKKIFKKFFRVDERLSREVQGSGLGLTISKFLAEAHDGDILVESTRGVGSKFTLVLPVGKPKRID